MTTIIRDRTILSDRITKWARRCFQNRYDCRAFALGRCCARKCPLYIIIEIRCRVNSDDFETTEVEVRLPCQYINCLKYISVPPSTRLFFRRHTLYISPIKNVRNISVIVKISMLELIRLRDII